MQQQHPGPKPSSRLMTFSSSSSGSNNQNMLPLPAPPVSAQPQTPQHAATPQFSTPKKQTLTPLPVQSVGSAAQHARLPPSEDDSADQASLGFRKP
eukprot:10109229-Alexandrium_andersonii.AAC.1